MPAHPIDFQIQSEVFATSELLAVFDEKVRFQRWLQFEAALAFVQGDLGIIPLDAAKEINVKANIEHLDLVEVAKEYQRSRNSLMPIVNGLRKACDKGFGEYVHYGVTTQDVLDTAQILELKDALKIVYRDLRKFEAILVDLSQHHRDTPMVGRTHGQQALPITFGLKTAIWAGEIRRHIDRMLSLPARVLVGQLSGAVGTMAALGPKAPEVAAKTLSRLGLGCAPASWHTSRDNIAETGSCFAMLAGTFEKIANEIFQLGKTELFELREASPQKAMSSSTMPHKRNPVICQRVAVLAKHIRSLSGVIVESMAHEHERDARCLWAEWLAVPQISIYTGTMIHYLLGVMEQLEVNVERMAENLRMQKDSVVSEWLLFRLGTEMGKMRAQKKLFDLFEQISASNMTMKEILQGDSEIETLLSPDDYDMLDHPERYIGHAGNIVETILAEIESKRQNDPQGL